MSNQLLRRQKPFGFVWVVGTPWVIERCNLDTIFSFQIETWLKHLPELKSACLCCDTPFGVSEPFVWSIVLRPNGQIWLISGFCPECVSSRANLMDLSLEQLHREGRSVRPWTSMPAQQAGHA
jgi:hypothetical protein